MAAADKKQSRVEKERARVYRARQEFHQGLLARRRRDNVVAGVAGALLILAVVGGQVAYYTAGPGTPVPTPSPTDTGTPATPPAQLPGSSEISTPTPTPTP